MSLISLKHVQGKKIEIFKSNEEVANAHLELINKTKKDLENSRLAGLKAIAAAKKIVLD